MLLERTKNKPVRLRTKIFDSLESKDEVSLKKIKLTLIKV